MATSVGYGSTVNAERSQNQPVPHEMKGKYTRCTVSQSNGVMWPNFHAKLASHALALITDCGLSNCTCHYCCKFRLFW